MNLPGFPGFNHQTDLGPLACLDQVKVDRCRRQQGRNGHMLGIHFSVRNDQDVITRSNSLLGFRTKAI